MQNPSTWDPLYKVEQATSHARAIPRALSSASVASHPRRRRREEDDIAPPEAVQRDSIATRRPPIVVNVVPPDDDQVNIPPADNPFDDFTYAETSFQVDPSPAEHVLVSPRSTQYSHLVNPEVASKKRVSFASIDSEGDQSRVNIEVSGALSPNSEHSRYSNFHFDKS